MANHLRAKTLRILPLAVIGLFSAMATDARAQFTFASDNATSYNSSTWINTSDLGSGFGGWGITAGTGSGTFVGSPAGDGMGTTGIGTSAFALFANNTGYVNASRGFDTSMGIGDTFSFYWAINWDAGAGSKGFDLRSGGTTIFNVNNGGSENITTTGGGTITGFGTTPMLVTLTRAGMGTYSFSMTSRSGGSTFSTTISSSSAIDNFNFYAGNQTPSSGNRNMYFNVFSITNSGVFSSGGTVTNANTFSGSGNLSVGANTTLVLSGGGNNNYSGSTTISNGSTLFFAGSGTSDFASAISNGGAIVVSNGAGQVNLQANNSSFTGNITVANGSLEAQSANALGPGSGTTTVQSGGTLRLWNASGLSYAAEALTLNGSGVGASGALRNITNNNTWQGAITLGSASRINSDAGTLTIDVASGSAVTGTFDLTIGGNGNVTVNDNIGIGTAKLVKDGLGTLTLGAVNNYTGNTEIDAGTLAIGSTGGLSSSSMLYVGSGLNGSDAALSVAGSATLANAIQVNTNNGTSGARTIIKSDATSQTLSGAFTNNIQTSVNVANSAGNLALSGAMAGAGNIVKSGSGTLALSGNSSSFTGGLYIDQGTLNLAGGSTSASLIDIGGGADGGAVTASNAALRVSANSTFNQAITVNSNAIGGISGTRTIEFANTGGTATLSGNITQEKAFTANVANAGAIGILSGVLSASTGSGGPTITVSGNGILGVNNVGNTTDARWNVSSGATLAIGNTRNLGADPGGYYSDKLTMNGGTLQATNSFGLNANVGIQLGASTTSTISVGSGLVMTNPAVMGGTGNLTKSGSGTLVLSGNNTYSGSTTVSQGELRMMGALSSSSLLNVNAGATLSGTGTIGGATAISGIHSPGTSPGIQTFSSDLTYNAGSTFRWELTANTNSAGARGTLYDGVNLGSGANLTFAGTTKMSLVFNSAGSSVSWSDTFWSSDKSWLVYDLNGAGAITGTNNFSVDSINWVDSQGNLFTQSRPDASFSISVSGQDLNLIYTIPEPSTYALLALSGVALGFCAYRRRRRSML